MSQATRFIYTTALSVTAAICFAAKATSDDAPAQLNPADFADIAEPKTEASSASTRTALPLHDRIAELPVETAGSGKLSAVAKTLNNGAVVSAHLLRSAQPTPAQFQALEKAGVKTIINLRDGQKDIDYEKGIVEKLGMQYVSIPMSSFKPVRQTQIQSFMAIVADPKNQPVLVHCRQGEDRTGTVCGLYRMKKQGWTGPQAYKEMIAFGFHPEFVMLDQAIVDASKSTAEPLTMPTFSDMTSDIKSRIGRLYQNIGTSRGFMTNF